MSHEIRVFAPAKINLNLRVCDKRADGYHDIESIFQQIHLSDHLVVSGLKKNLCELTVNGMELPPENTITTAYAVFCKYTGISSGLRVRLTKRIPAGAGLGGGSSDAAAVLRALDLLYKTEVSADGFQAMAESIGSDVPFFLSGEAALVTGRGERIKKIVSRTDFYLVLIYPEVHSSTGKAFHLVDDWYCNASNNRVGWLPASKLEAEYRKPPREWAFKNSFTLPLMSVYPVINLALGNLRDVGASFVDMTGSGSTVFGVFETCAKAKNAHAWLCKNWKFCFLTEPFVLGHEEVCNTDCQSIG